MTLQGRPTRSARGAFTLVEVLVVMIIIAVLATLTVPRLIGTQGRQAEIEAGAVRSLLSQAAQQDALSSGRLSLGFDHQKKELAVQALTPDKDDPSQRQWKSAPMTRPLTLALLELSSASADGQVLAPETDFRIEFAGGRPRPAVSLLLRTPADMPGPARAWQVDLLPGQTVATIRAAKPDAPLAPPQADAVDLDLQGLRTQPW